MPWWIMYLESNDDMKNELFRTEELLNPRYSTWLINFREIPIDGIIVITIPLFVVDG